MISNPEKKGNWCAGGGGGERRRQRKFLNEEHLVFTGGGTGRGFHGSGESSYDGGEYDVGALGGIDGCVQPPGAVVLHKRGCLPVIGLQTGAQRCFIVVATADEGLACHLGAEKRVEMLKALKQNVHFVHSFSHLSNLGFIMQPKSDVTFSLTRTHTEIHLLCCVN